MSFFGTLIERVNDDVGEITERLWDRGPSKLRGWIFGVSGLLLGFWSAFRVGERFGVLWAILVFFPVARLAVPAILSVVGLALLYAFCFVRCVIAPSRTIR